MIVMRARTSEGGAPPALNILAPWSPLDDSLITIFLTIIGLLLFIMQFRFGILSLLYLFFFKLNLPLFVKLCFIVVIL